MKKFIEVIAAEGARCFTAPAGGTEIPAGKAVSVLLTPWIENYLRSGDLLAVPAAPAPAKAPPPAHFAAAEPQKPVPAKGS